MKKKIAILVLIVIGVYAITFALVKSVATAPVPHEKTKSAIIAGKNFTIDIADTPELQEKGLGGKDSIGENYGMLFPFQIPQKYGFWMKDMKIPIDIVWLDSSCTVVFVKENAKPEDYPEVYYPNSPAQYVLEIAPGESASLGMTPGMQFNFCQ